MGVKRLKWAVACLGSIMLASAASATVTIQYHQFGTQNFTITLTAYQPSGTYSAGDANIINAIFRLSDSTLIGDGFTLSDIDGDLIVSNTYSHTGLVTQTAHYTFADVGDDLTQNGSFTGSDSSGNSFTLTVSGIPEPSSWLMMIGGFGWIGATLRRRNASRSFA